MQIKSICTILILILVLVGCAGRLPTVCDEVKGPSLLCDTAERYGVRLEDVGNGLIIANAIAIAEGLYTIDEAVEVMTELRDILDDPITYVTFKVEVYKRMEKYPGLIEVATVYFDELGGMAKEIYPIDRKLLVGWLDKQIKTLGG